MGLFNLDLKGAGEAAQGVSSAVTSLLSGVRQAITGELSPEKRAELEKQAADLEAAAQQAQAKINEVEAASSSLFVAGWRPYLGWILGTAAGCYFIPKFVLATALWAIQVVNTGSLVPYPEVGWQDVVTLLGGLLGFGGLRTYEKVKAAQGNH